MAARFTIIGFFFFITIASANGEPSSQQTCLTHILISGSSNFNNFEIVFDSTEPIVSYVDNLSDENSLIFNVPVEKFKANNHLMLQDFKRLIQAEKFPNIGIFLAEKELGESGKIDEFTLGIDVWIMVAGCKKKYTIPVNDICVNELNESLSGMVLINLADFNLNNLDRFFGLIKLKNEVLINFKLSFVC